MNIYDLEILTRESDQYNLDQRTFDWSLSVPFEQYIVDRSEEMRIDLICRSIYGNIDNIGFLMYYNNIDNPMNIKSGDSIRFISEDLIGLFKISSDERTSREFLEGLNRGSQVDPNRTDYNNLSNNPTFNSQPVEQVVDRNGVIIIGNRD
jgi:hypothetical protein